MQDQELAAQAAALTARFRAAGINAEPGYGGSVIIYASAIEAEAILANLEIAGQAGGRARTQHPDASADRYGYAPDESGNAKPGPPEAVNVYRVALLFSAIASADATLREAMEQIVEDPPTAPRIVAKWLQEAGS
jgi:hypothetical protein